MKDAYYFSHDSNAKSDPKISAMINQYKIEGYGRFWIVVEILREQQEYRLPLKKYIFDALALQMQCSAEEAEKYIKDCIETFELFASDGEYFWSNSLIRRMKQKEERSRQASKAAQKRWGQSNNNADAMQTQCGSNANKVKEKKVKEKKKDLYAEELSLEKQLHSENQEKTFSAAELIKSFEKDFARPLGSTESEQVISWLKVHQPEVIKEALRRAVLNGKYNFRYIDKILLSWEKANKRTLREVLEYEQAIEQQRKRSGPTEEASKVVQISEKRREETIRSACDYIMLQCGPDPPREKAEEIALRYGEEFVPVIIRQLFGGISP